MTPATTKAGKASGGGKMRSREGCLTCKRRRKKCDETRKPEHNGACERCFTSSYKCEWLPPPDERPVRSFVQGSRSANRSAGVGASTSAEVSLDAGALPAFAPTSASFGASSAPSYRPPSVLKPTPVQPSRDDPTPGPSVTAATAFPPLHTPAHPPQPFPSVPAALHFPSAPTTTTAQPNTPALPASHAPASLDPMADFDLTHLNLMPFFPSTSGVTNDLGLGNFWASLDSEIPNWEMAMASTSTGGDWTTWNASAVAASPAPGSAPTVPAPSAWSTPREDPEEAVPPAVPSGADDGSEEKETMQLYNKINMEWYGGLPAPIADVIVNHIGNVATSNATAKNAAMATVMLYRLRTLQAEKQSTDPAEAAHSAAMQACLLAQGNAYFQEALDRLNDTEIPFEAKMFATWDLMGYQFDQYGAAALKSLVPLIHFFVVEELGPRPVLQLKPLSDPRSFVIVTTALHDLADAMVNVRRRPLFTFPDLSDPAFASSASRVDDFRHYCGLPTQLMLCIAAIANLALDMEALPEEVTKAKADQIEAVIRSWRPAPPEMSDILEGAPYLNKLSTAEMWRWTSIIYLYQAVHRLGPVASVIADARSQLIAVGSQVVTPAAAAPPPPPPPSSSTTPGSAASPANPPTTTTAVTVGPPVNGPTPGRQPYPTGEDLFLPFHRALPWFLAGTCSFSPADRAACRKGLEACVLYKAGVDNLNALEAVWSEMDRTGWPVEWRALLKERGIVIAF
ncbi:hypothetical protein JCM10207_006987 [Rhodosporidiobolus poonsookiae]